MNNMKDAVITLLLQVLGAEWYKSARVEEIRLDEKKIDVLVAINQLVHADTTGAELLKIRRHCPQFCEVYREVMLRDIEDPISNGKSN